MSSWEDLDFESILEECDYTHAVVFVPRFCLLGSVKILVSTGLSAAHCGVFIIADIPILMLLKNKIKTRKGHNFFKNLEG